MVNGESESGEDEKGRKKVEEGEGMAGFRPGKEENAGGRGQRRLV